MPLRRVRGIVYLLASNPFAPGSAGGISQGSKGSQRNRPVDSELSSNYPDGPLGELGEGRSFFRKSKRINGACQESGVRGSEESGLGVSTTFEI